MKKTLSDWSVKKMSETKTIKVYSWADLCDYEQLLLEKWRITQEMRQETLVNDNSVTHKLKIKYLNVVSETIKELGIEVTKKEVSENLAKELGFKEG